MKVTYNGFTGLLMKLDGEHSRNSTFGRFFDLTIFDMEKNVTYYFACVDIADVKFMGGAVSFGG